MKLYRYARETKQATKQTSLYDSDIPKKKNKQTERQQQKKGQLSEHTDLLSRPS